jgi:hypothetical protein
LAISNTFPLKFLGIEIAHYPAMKNLIPIEKIENKIYYIRGEKVILDEDLAKFYRVTTFNLNKTVKRNRLRFPKDFMFQLNYQEYHNLLFQFGISSWGGRRNLPYAFTEQGVAILSGLLKSKRAILINVAIMRAFVKLRRLISSHKDISEKLSKLTHITGKHDEEIQLIFEVIEKLIGKEKASRYEIGFKPADERRRKSS